MLKRLLSILLLAMHACTSLGRHNNVDRSGYLPEAVDLTTSFTIANTDIGSVWTAIPYRERYLRRREDGPCKTFSLKLPDEQPNMTSLELCIFRSILESALETPQSLFTSSSVDPSNLINDQRKLSVEGYVLKHPKWRVNGYVIHRCFYGTIHMVEPKTEKQTVFIVEEASILPGLMNNDMKLLKSLLYVMKRQPQRGSISSEYNAVVSKDRTLASFLTDVMIPYRTKRLSSSSPSVLNTFIAFSSDENTFIMPGEPSLNIDGEGRLKLSVEQNSITVENDGSVIVKAHDVEYKIRPSGLAVATKGAEIETLQENAGAVAVMAVSSNMSFNCLLPPPSFNPARQGGFLCKVCVLPDESFLAYYRRFSMHKDEENILFHVIDRASWIFRSVDWDLDGSPDNIGLLYAEKAFSWSEKMQYIDGAVNKEELKLLFAELSQQDFSDCCLAIAYTMYAFPPPLFSMSSPTTSSPFGSGICAVRTSAAISNNVILISANDREGIYSPMTLEQLTYVTTHEIAKSFGAPKEITGKERCDQFKDRQGHERHHIMWPDLMRNITEEEKTFSLCTKKTIHESLSSCKTACFQIDPYPFCGNGIVEDGEECDCGHSYECSQRLCCYARSGRYPCMKTGIACLPSASKILRVNGIFWLFPIVYMLFSIMKI